MNRSQIIIKSTRAKTRSLVSHVVSIGFLLLIGCRDDEPICNLSASYTAGDDCQANASSPRNYLVILMDDLRYSAIFQETPIIPLPNIQRLICEGTSFNRAYVTTSLCSPSRASILSGQYVHTHGITNNTTNWNGRHIGNYMKPHVDRSAFIGKWHMGTDDSPKDGFDHWVSFKGQGDYVDPILNINGTSCQTKGHMNKLLTDFAIDFIDAADCSFFMFLSHKAVHGEYIPEDQDLNATDYQAPPIPETYYTKPENKPNLCFNRNILDEAYLTETYRNYFLTLKGADRQIGRIMDHLEAKGLLDQTMILFTSDNGFLLGEHQQTNKRYAYEPSVQVPLIIRDPANFGAETQVIQNIALNIDIVPTLLEAAEAPIPSELQGVPLQKIYSGEVSRDEFVYQLIGDQRYECWPDHRALITLDYKYIDHPEGNIQLYERASDPDEIYNLYVDTNYRQLADSLAARLVVARAAINDI